MRQSFSSQPQLPPPLPPAPPGVRSQVVGIDPLVAPCPLSCPVAPLPRCLCPVAARRPRGPWPALRPRGPAQIPLREMSEEVHHHGAEGDGHPNGYSVPPPPTVALACNRAGNTQHEAGWGRGPWVAPPIHTYRACTPPWVGVHRAHVRVRKRHATGRRSWVTGRPVFPPLGPRRVLLLLRRGGRAGRGHQPRGPGRHGARGGGQASHRRRPGLP